MLALCALRPAGYVPPGLTGVVVDTFTRANNASSLGSAETGQVWTAHGGTWGVIGGAAYLATRAGDDAATVDSGLSTCNIYCDITREGEPGLSVRYVDPNNWVEVHCNATTVQMWKRVGGTYANIQNADATLPAGTVHNFRVEVAGTTIRVYLDAVLIITATGQTDFQTATRQGFRQNDVSTARYDNFRVTA